MCKQNIFDIQVTNGVIRWLFVWQEYNQREEPTEQSSLVYAGRIWTAAYCDGTLRK